MEELNTYYDLGSLSMYDTDVINFTPENQEETIDALVSKNYKRVISRIKNIQTELEENLETRKLENQYVDFGKDRNLIELPKVLTIFPRYRTMPTEQGLTRWEKFAKEKGIKKKSKRSKLVYNEELQDWVPRYGKYSTKKVADKLDIIRVVKPGKFVDPWQKGKDEKSFGKSKQKLNELKNVMRKKGLNPNMKDPNARRVKRIRKGKVNSLQNKKKKINHALSNVAVSNSSLGRFDHKTNKEIKRTKAAHDKKPHFKTFKEERNRNKDVLRRVLMD